MRSILRVCASLLVASWMTACLLCSPQQTAGSVTEGGNVEAVSLVGHVKDSLGNPIPNATVKLRPLGYLMDTSLITGPTDSLVSARNTTTNALGEFRFDDVDTGQYVIEVVGPGSQGTLTYWHATGETLVEALPPDTVLPLGTITGLVVMDDNLGAYNETCFIQVYGLDRVVQTDSTGAFVVRGIPAGVYKIRISSANPLYVIVVVEGLRLVAGGTANAGTLELTINDDSPPPD